MYRRLSVTGVRVKRSPIFPKVAQKVTTAGFWKNVIFTIAANKNVAKHLGLFFEKFSRRTFKNRSIWSHWSTSKYAHINHGSCCITKMAKNQRRRRISFSCDRTTTMIERMIMFQMFMVTRWSWGESTNAGRLLLRRYEFESRWILQIFILYIVSKERKST